MKKIRGKIKELSEAIKESSEFKEHQIAWEGYNNNPEAQSLWQEFQESRQNLIILREGSFSGQEEEKARFEDLLKKVKANKDLNHYLKSKKELDLFLSSLARDLSDDIGFEFIPSRKKSCCS